MAKLTQALLRPLISPLMLPIMAPEVPSLGPPVPMISFPDNSIDEGATTGREVGTASVVNPPEGAGTFVWTELGGTGAGLFAIDSSTGVITNTAALDYETATSYTYEVGADDGLGNAYTRTLTISVTNVYEAANLAALGFDDSELVQSASSTVNITSATSGSTLTASGLPAGMSINSGARTITGTPTTVGTGSATITETLADSANSPRDTVWNWEIVEAPAEVPAQIHVSVGDSTIRGLPEDPENPGYGRELGVDTDWANVFQGKIDGTISADTTPLDSLGPNTGDPFSLMEYVGKTVNEDTGADIYIIQCAVSGSYIDESTDGWAVGASLHEAAIPRINTLIAAIQAIDPSAELTAFFERVGSNNYDTDMEPFYTLMSAHVADMRSRIFMNGISGTTAADANVKHVFITPTIASLRNVALYPISEAMRLLSLEVEGGLFFRPPIDEVGTTAEADLHDKTVGVRITGTRAAEYLLDDTAPDFDFDDQTIGSNDPFRMELLAGPGHGLVDSDDTVNYFATGTDADDFEFVFERRTDDGNSTEAARVYHYIQYKDGITHPTGTKNITINCKGSAITSVPWMLAIGAATLTSPTDAADGHDAAGISVSCAIGSGTLYWYISTSATPPSASDLMAGTGAVAFGSQAVSATGVQNASPTGLSAETLQYAHFLHERTDGHISAIATGDGFTTDAAPSAGIAFVAHEVARYTSAGSGATTDAMNTTDADFLIISISGYGASAWTVSDSKGNTWTPLTEYAENPAIQHYYCANPTKGTGHTFSLTGDAVYGRINVSAFSGVQQSGAFDTVNFTQGDGSNWEQTSGAVTPVENGSLLLAFYASNGSTITYTGTPAFTVLDTHDGIGGQTYTTALGYYIQSTAGSINSAWTSASYPGGAPIASLTVFKPA